MKIKERLMRIQHVFLRIIKLDGETDEKVEMIYRQPIKQLKEVDKQLKKVNKLMYHKDVAYHIAKSMGIL